MNKRITIRVVAGTAAAALLGLSALAAPAQADSAWGRSANKDGQSSRIIGAPSSARIIGGADQTRIIG